MSEHDSSHRSLLDNNESGNNHQEDGHNQSLTSLVGNIWENTSYIGLNGTSNTGSEQNDRALNSIVSLSDGPKNISQAQQGEVERVMVERNKARSERKRCRERQRRVDVNAQFAELTDILEKIDPDGQLSNSFDGPISSSNRVTIIARTVAVLDRLIKLNHERDMHLQELQNTLRQLKEDQVRKVAAASSVPMDGSNSQQSNVSQQSFQQPQCMMMVPMLVSSDRSMAFPHPMTMQQMNMMGGNNTNAQGTPSGGQSNGMNMPPMMQMNSMPMANMMVGSTASMTSSESQNMMMQQHMNMMNTMQGMNHRQQQQPIMQIPQQLNPQQTTNSIPGHIPNLYHMQQTVQDETPSSVNFQNETYQGTDQESMVETAGLGSSRDGNQTNLSTSFEPLQADLSQNDIKSETKQDSHEEKLRAVI